MGSCGAADISGAKSVPEPGGFRTAACPGNFLYRKGLTVCRD